jgi:hypothetical protein
MRHSSSSVYARSNRGPPRYGHCAEPASSTPSTGHARSNRGPTRYGHCAEPASSTPSTGQMRRQILQIGPAAFAGPMVNV